jgi:putative ABC transport system permease protein
VRINRVLGWISLFVWFVGLGTVVAGVVAVSNIMLISVRERTREFGIRKALGATPGSIVSMVLKEAVVLTAVSGYVGLVLGVALLEVSASALPANDFFRDPEVSLGSALAATGLLVVFGALAGYFPARRAARINPIDALRDE